MPSRYVTVRFFGAVPAARQAALHRFHTVVKQCNWDGRSRRRDQGNPHFELCCDPPPGWEFAEIVVWDQEALLDDPLGGATVWNEQALDAELGRCASASGAACGWSEWTAPGSKLRMLHSVPVGVPLMRDG